MFTLTYLWQVQTKGPMSLGHGMYHWGCGPYEICLNYKPSLTFIKCQVSASGPLSRADDWPKVLLKDFTGQIGATSSDIYQNVCLYVQLQSPVDDIVADEY